MSIFCHGLRLSGQTSVFGGVSKSLLEMKKLKTIAILIQKPRIHVRILMYQTWRIACLESFNSLVNQKLHSLHREPIKAAKRQNGSERVTIISSFKTSDWIKK